MSLVGTTVRHIRLLRRLGTGGMGEVYEGRDEKLQRLVAVKVLRAERRLDSLNKRRFLREARILSRIEHPNICRVLDFVEGEGTDFIVLELVPGQTLDHAIEQGLDSAEQRNLADQIAEALAAAHSLGIVHRDLKPANIMVTPRGAVKVLDFGLARTFGDSAVEGDSSDGVDTAGRTPAPTLTVGGGVLGTPAYMSPEQARGEPATAASDMYSFGLVLKKLFTGKDPYPAGIPLEILLQKAMWGDTLPAEGLPRDLARLVSDLVALDPTKRPPAAVCLARLRWIWETPKRRLRRAGWLGLAATLVLATVISSVGFVHARRAQRRAQASEKAAQGAKSQALAVNRFLVDMLAAASPRRMGRNVRMVDILDQAAESVKGALSENPLTEAAVRHALGTTYLSLGELDKASRQLDRAYSLRSHLLGADSDAALETRTVSGELLRAQGRLDEAEALLAETTATCRQALGATHPTTLRCATQYGVILAQQRKFGDSIAVLEEVHGAYPAQSDPVGRLEATLALASALRKVDRLDDAGHLIRKALSDATTRLGKAHPTTLAALQAMAVLEDRQDHVEKADRLFREIQSSCIEVFGADHPMTLRATLNVTVALCRLNRMRRAEEMLAPLVATCEEKLGPVHPITLEALRGLGYAISLQRGREAEAEPIYRRRFDDTRRLLGPEHRMTMEAESGLAAYYLFAGRHGRAETLYREVLGTRRRVFGEGHPATLRSKRALARLLRATGREAEAATLETSGQS